jgi:6-pyruvoyltetrahydropterin/6-carboxytetrahydropterin synthase
LNNVFGFNPTAENIARHLFEIGKSFWPQVSAVRVSETDKTWAEYAE